MDKIVQLSELFDVSTDYLLKDVKDENQISYTDKVPKTDKIIMPEKESQIGKKSHTFIIGLVFSAMSFLGLIIYWIL